MRDKNYRRRQEAKHYNKRINNSISRNRFKKVSDENGNTQLVPNYGTKDNVWRIYSKTPLNDYEKKLVNKVKYKRWKFQLKNDSCPSHIDSFSKRCCRRNRRHFQKMVDYKLPDKKWLVRAQVIYPRDIV